MRMTFCNSFHTKPDTAFNAIYFNCFKRIFGARRIKSTMIKRKNRRYKVLIHSNHQDTQPFHVFIRGQTKLIVEDRSAIVWFMNANLTFFGGVFTSPLYKNTISYCIPESIFATKSSFLVRNASFMSRFKKLR